MTVVHVGKLYLGCICCIASPSQVYIDMLYK